MIEQHLPFLIRLNKYGVKRNDTDMMMSLIVLTEQQPHPQLMGGLQGEPQAPRAAPDHRAWNMLVKLSVRYGTIHA